MECRPKKDDPIYDLVDHHEALNNGPFLKQLTNMQVLDYICGNTDRHLGNMLYQVEYENGVLKAKGVMGIDNDRSLGLLTKKGASTSAFLVPPERMVVISQSALDSINSLDKNKLKLTLKDLNFTDDEISACIRRIGDIKKAVKDKKLRVVQDNEFENLDINDLARSKKSIRRLLREIFLN